MSVDSISASSAAAGAAYPRSRELGRLTTQNDTSFYEKARTDSVSLSPAGNCISSLIGALHGVEPDQNGNISIEDLRQKYQENNAEYGRKLTTLLKNAGVDTGTAMEFRVDGKGRVREVSGHPQKERIEKIINEDHPEAANRIREQSALASFLKAADDYLEFAAAYAKDPKAAVARYAGLFSEYRQAVTLGLENGSLAAQGCDQT